MIIIDFLHRKGAISALYLDGGMEETSLPSLRYVPEDAGISDEPMSLSN